MGYYDGPNLNEEHSETREVRKSGSKKGYFFTGLVGAVVGAVSISFAAHICHGLKIMERQYHHLVRIQK